MSVVHHCEQIEICILIDSIMSKMKFCTDVFGPQGMKTTDFDFDFLSTKISQHLPYRFALKWWIPLTLMISWLLTYSATNKLTFLVGGEMSWHRLDGFTLNICGSQRMNTSSCKFFSSTHHWVSEPVTLAKYLNNYGVKPWNLLQKFVFPWGWILISLITISDFSVPTAGQWFHTLSELSLHLHTESPSWPQYFSFWVFQDWPRNKGCHLNPSRGQSQHELHSSHDTAGEWVSTMPS